MLSEEWRRRRPHSYRRSAAESSPTACVYSCVSGPKLISMTAFVNARLEARQREYRLSLAKPCGERQPIGSAADGLGSVSAQSASVSLRVSCSREMDSYT